MDSVLQFFAINSFSKIAHSFALDSLSQRCNSFDIEYLQQRMRVKYLSIYLNFALDLWDQTPRLCRKMLNLEIETLKPKHVLFLTGLQQAKDFLNLPDTLELNNPVNNLGNFNFGTHTNKKFSVNIFSIAN